MSKISIANMSTVAYTDEAVANDSPASETSRLVAGVSMRYNFGGVKEREIYDRAGLNLAAVF